MYGAIYIAIFIIGVVYVYCIGFCHGIHHVKKILGIPFGEKFCELHTHSNSKVLPIALLPIAVVTAVTSSIKQRSDLL